VLPGGGGAVGLGPVLMLGTGVVGATVAVRVAVGAAVVGWLAAAVGLGLVRGRTTRSGPQALSATNVMAIRRTLRGRERGFNASIVRYPRWSVEFAYKPASPSYAERTRRASTTVLR
jgi:hypothetical protein